ncbi:unnamed protein product [Penicillium manginii]
MCSDPLPFMLLSDEKKAGRNGHTIFVDIDYEKLMDHKKRTIQESNEITSVLEDAQFGEYEDPIQIRSSRYIAVGCDMYNLKKLDEVLRTSVLPSTDCSVLFLAEVSLTYMDVKSAHNIVTWASKLTNDVQFCILEQFFPDGPDHPFAKTMMTHFNKVRAPLFSIHEFPTLAQQEQRFRNAGWSEARARSLWDLWSDSEFLPDSIRIGLDSFEAFDEWEEFAVFASHYFVLIASNSPGAEKTKCPEITNQHASVDVSSRFALTPHCSPENNGRRRYGALVPDSDHSVGYHGGQGEQSRLASTDLYTRIESIGEPLSTVPPAQIPTRMCHTVTPLASNSGCLLVGGRTSPTAPLGDCWIRRDNSWSQVQPLPQPRFRHNATDVLCGDETSSILVYGGKSNNHLLLDSWVLWNDKDERGWQDVKVKAVGSSPQARFGASFSKINDHSGVLFGGIGATGTILEDFWSWDLSRCEDGSLQVEITDLTQSIRDAVPQLSPFLSRFGATVNTTSFGLIVAGGIIPRQIVPADKEILLLDIQQLVTLSEKKQCDPTVISSIGLGAGFEGPRPLLTGHVAHTIGTDAVLLLGGGGVCYAFGNFWSEGSWLLQSQDARTGNTWTISTAESQFRS